MEDNPPVPAAVTEAATWVGAFPPTVTVTVSMDCLAFDAWPAAALLALVMTSSPHRTGFPFGPGPPYCTWCWMAQAGTGVESFPGTVTTMRKSLQLEMLAFLPPMVTV